MCLPYYQGQISYNGTIYVYLLHNSCALVHKELVHSGLCLTPQPATLLGGWQPRSQSFPTRSQGFHPTSKGVHCWRARPVNNVWNKIPFKIYLRITILWPWKTDLLLSRQNLLSYNTCTDSVTICSFSCHSSWHMYLFTGKRNIDLIPSVFIQ